MLDPSVVEAVAKGDFHVWAIGTVDDLVFEDFHYADGGLKMLPGCDPCGKRTAFVMVATAAALIPLGFLAAPAGLGGWLFAAGATVFGVYFLRRAVEFARDRTDRKARRVLHASLIYLPAVFSILMIDALLLK